MHVAVDVDSHQSLAGPWAWQPSQVLYIRPHAPNLAKALLGRLPHSYLAANDFAIHMVCILCKKI